MRVDVRHVVGEIAAAVKAAIKDAPKKKETTPQPKPDPTPVADAKAGAAKVEKPSRPDPPSGGESASDQTAAAEGTADGTASADAASDDKGEDGDASTGAPATTPSSGKKSSAGDTADAASASTIDTTIDAAKREELERRQQQYEDQVALFVAAKNQAPSASGDSPEAKMSAAAAESQRQTDLDAQIADAGRQFWDETDYYVQDGEIYHVSDRDEKSGEVTLERNDVTDADGVVTDTQITIDEVGAQETVIRQEHPDGTRVTDRELQDSTGQTVGRQRVERGEDAEGRPVLSTYVEDADGPLSTEVVTSSKTDTGTTQTTITTQYGEDGGVSAVERRVEFEGNPVTLDDGSQMIEQTVQVDVVDGDGYDIEGDGFGAGTHSTFERTVAVLSDDEDPQLAVYKSTSVGEGSALAADSFEAIAGTYTGGGDYADTEDLLRQAVDGEGPLATLGESDEDDQLEDVQLGTWDRSYLGLDGMPTPSDITAANGTAFGIDGDPPYDMGALLNASYESDWERPNGTLTGQELYERATRPAQDLYGPDLVVFPFGTRDSLVASFDGYEQEGVQANQDESGDRDFGALVIDEGTELTATGPDGEEHDDWRPVEQRGNSLVLERDGEQITVSLESIVRGNIEELVDRGSFAHSADDEDSVSFGWRVSGVYDDKIELVRPADGVREEISVDEFLKLNSVYVRPLEGREEDVLVDETIEDGYARTSAPLYGPDGPSPDDIYQGGLGDCYLLTALGAQVQSDPSAVEDIITDNNDGTYTVQIGEEQVTVSGELVGGSDPRYQGSGGGDEPVPIWAAIIEKAYASVHGDSYADIEGGNAGETLRELFGTQSADTGVADEGRVDSDGDIAAQIKELVEADVPVMLSSNSGSDATVVDTVVQGHALWVDRVEKGKDGKLLVYVRNPWGLGNTEPRPMTSDELRENYRAIQTPSGSVDI